MSPLRQRMIEDMQVRNFSPHTQANYVQQIYQFARHFHRSPDALGPEEIRSYQVYLTNDKKLAPGSILIAVSALRFLYKVTLKREWTVENVIPAPKKPQLLPFVLSPEEVLHFLDCVKSSKEHATLTTCYAARLRSRESRGLPRGDRKSTRLNSSHTVSSYAVFCLKTKNQTSGSPATSASGLTSAPVYPLARRRRGPRTRSTRHLNRTATFAPSAGRLSPP